ncbi:MAG: hypothetical protein ACYCXK_09545 [Candidatus Humimicrobiaceae bacterium]
MPIDDNWNPVGPYVPFLDGRAQDEAEYVRNNTQPIWVEEAGNSNGPLKEIFGKIADLQNIILKN